MSQDEDPSDTNTIIATHTNSSKHSSLKENDSDNDDDNTTFETTYDSDDEPPKLKYSRLTSLPPSFFNKDPISCTNFHENYFIFATHSGMVHITDTDLKPIRTFKAHRASILSIFNDGQFFATGSMDGTIVIGSILDEKDIIAYDFKRPIHAVILDRNFNKTRSFVSGGMSGKVIYSSKNWLGQRSDLVLDENNGPIVSITTVDDIILWINDKGISIYHVVSRQVIKVIDKPEISPRSDLYWPRVHFPETDRILIGWANHIWLLRIAIRTQADKVSDNGSSNMSRILPSAASISFRAIQEKKVEIEHVFKLDSLIAGISSYKDDYWMVLAFDEPNETITDESLSSEVELNKTLNEHYPDLKLINSLTGEVDFEEEIGLRNVQGLGLNDYNLSIHIGDDVTRYFIVSAKDAVIAQEVQLSDQLDWFMEHEKYSEAYDISEHILTPNQRLNIGIQYVDSLIAANQWDRASEFLKKILCLNYDKLPDSDTKSTVITAATSDTKSSKYDDEYVNYIVQQWESWSMIFLKSGHQQLLSDILPHTAALSISVEIYDEILRYWLVKDVNKFVDLISQWDMDVYTVKTIEDLMETYLAENKAISNLTRTLIDLYVKTGEPQKAVVHLISLRDYDIIKFLSTHHLLLAYINQLPQIILLRFKQGDFGRLPITELVPHLTDVVDILVERRHEIAPATIIDLMSRNQLNLVNYLYLEKLEQIDDFLISNFGNERIKLYTEYNRTKLLPYLMKHSNYNIDYAIETCENNEFYEELVFLLGKIGENKKALMLIIDKLDDPEIAINFAKHQNDKEAWTILLDYSMNKPKFIQALIEGADDQSNPFYDPISIIRRIPNDVKLPGLKKSVTSILENNEINLLLNQLVLKIISKRAERISTKYKEGLLKGIEVNIKNEFKEFLDKIGTILVYNDPVTDTYKFKLEEGERSILVFDGLQRKVDHLRELQPRAKS